MTKSQFLLILTGLAFLACQPRTEEHRPTIQYVRDVLADNSGPVYSLLSQYAEADRKGDIVIIGTEEQCFALGTQFTTCDLSDNVDASAGGDGLPDFGGEFIATIIDDASTPYSGYIDRDDADGLREAVVRSVICAIDTTYSLTAYDVECQGRKEAAKMVILADVHQQVYGKFDVDTLLNSTGCGIDVVTALSAMLDRALGNTVKREINLGIICPAGTEDLTLYQTAVSELLPGRKPNCFASPADASDTTNVLVSFLDRYIAAGNTAPLDAVIVDDYAVLQSDLDEGLRRASSLMSAESLTYAKYLADGIRVECPAEAVSATCFKLMRERNIFTHKISRPQLLPFKTVGRQDEGRMLLTPLSFYVQD